MPCLLKFSQPLLELLVAYARTPRTIANILKNPPVCSVVSSKDLRALGLRSSDFPVIKIAIVGPSYTGKSSLLKLYVKDTDPYTPSTLSYDLRMQTLRFNVSEYCQLQVHTAAFCFVSLIYWFLFFCAAVGCFWQQQLRVVCQGHYSRRARSVLQFAPEHDVSTAPLLIACAFLQVFCSCFDRRVKLRITQHTAHLTCGVRTGWKSSITTQRHTQA